MCWSNDPECQRFPAKDSVLGKNLNLDFATLNNLLVDRNDQVYAYVVATVEEKNGLFCQNGCAPNFQGGAITLCTCKHLMRTWHTPEEWVGKWIAGFTSVSIGRNYLFYLMKVEKGFGSFKELWENIDINVRCAKNASVTPLGDLYEPLGSCENNYRVPTKGPKEHVHLKHDDWINRDINYTAHGKKPALLLGSPAKSYIWTKRLIYSNQQIPRQALKFSNLDDFLSCLKT